MCEPYLAVMISDDCLLCLYVLWPVTILFGYHGNIQFKKKKKKKKKLNDNFFKTAEAV